MHQYVRGPFDRTLAQPDLVAVASGAERDETLGGAFAGGARAAPYLHQEEIAFVAFPGTEFTDAHRLGIYVRGTSALRSRIVEAIFADAGEAERPLGMPWYMRVLFLSEPLHFGNYGGWPLKVLWGLYDAVTIVVLGSGVFIWLRRWHRPKAVAPRSHSTPVAGPPARLRQGAK
jgi:PepSY-associated TM region